MEKLPEAGFLLAEADTVGVFEIFIKTTPERLWEAIIDPKQRAQYSFGVETRSDYTPGSRYEAVHPEAGITIAEGENLEVDPPRRLVQSFTALWGDDAKAEGASRVTWEIEQVESACRLTVVHDQLREGANAELYGGWPMILSGLKTLLETGETLTTPGSLRHSEACETGREVEMKGTRTPITGLRTVGIPVSDQDRALEFYVDSLGLEKRLDAPVEELGGRWIEVAPPGATTTIALVPAGEGVPTGSETGVRLTTADAAAVHADLRSRGVEVGELLRWPEVPPMFAVRDHDGNGLEIVEDA